MSLYREFWKGAEKSSNLWVIDIFSFVLLFCVFQVLYHQVINSCWLTDKNHMLENTYIVLS